MQKLQQNNIRSSNRTISEAPTEQYPKLQ